MFRLLLGLGLGLFVLSIAGFVTGISAQQPFAFGAAVLCGVPLSMFFLGGATFSFVANYQITPKSAEQPTRSTNSKIRLPRTQEIG